MAEPARSFFSPVGTVEGMRNVLNEYERATFG